MNNQNNQIVWKQFENTNYEVSNMGGVRNTKTGKTLNPSLSNCGYEIVSMSNNGKIKTANVHSLVAKTFIPNDNPQFYTDVHHIDGDKLNNKVSNLRWTTHAENVAEPQTEYAILRRYFLDSVELILHKAKEEGLNIHRVATEIMAFGEDVLSTNLQLKKIEYR
jgi:hypothetical protein